MMGLSALQETIYQVRHTTHHPEELAVHQEVDLVEGVVSDVLLTLVLLEEVVVY